MSPGTTTYPVLIHPILSLKVTSERDLDLHHHSPIQGEDQSWFHRRYRAMGTFDEGEKDGTQE